MRIPEMNYEKICYWAYIFMVGSAGLFFLVFAWQGLFGGGVDYAWSLKWGCEWKQP